MGSMKLSFLVLLIAQLAAAAPQMVIENCKDRCGDIMIPYPFGSGERRCYENEWFKVDCINNTKTLLSSIRLEVLSISVGRMSDDSFSYSKVMVKGPIKLSNPNCSGSDMDIDSGLAPIINLTGSPFFFSRSNEFIAVGCNTRASVTDNSTAPEIIGCNTRCSSTQSQEDLSIDWQGVFSSLHMEFRKAYPSCNGTGCCGVSLLDSLEVFDPNFEAIESDRGSCSMAFIASESWVYNQLYKVKHLQYVPLELSWDTKVFGMDQPTTICSPGRNNSYYSDCRCISGYEGNPYLGYCFDIDECKTPELMCQGITKCVNVRGYYKCVISAKWITVIAIGGMIVLTAILFGISWACKLVKRQRERTLKRKFFKRNGGLLLQQQINSADGSLQKTKIFTLNELEKATDNFNENRILGKGGQGTVYKGMLTDGRIVAVKKSTLVDEEKIQEFINEVVILSQINHRNVVTLFGCCLETEVPLLVYEYISNGSLFDYLHLQKDDFPLSWELRLQIATEAAGAVAYLHSTASIPIYHRDIKSTNMLLDEKFRAKVSDFGTSRSTTFEQTHLTTRVQGTVGYLDPEYFQSSQYTAKSDVYSFGVVLVELLSGQKPICWERSEESRSLATYFNLLMDENKLADIIDNTIMNEKHEEQIVAVANLAKICMNINSRFRPTMREVATELEHIRSLSTKKLPIQQNTDNTVLNTNPSASCCEFPLSLEVVPLISYQTW